MEEASTRVDALIYRLVGFREPEALYLAARHLIEAGGKRLRPYLVLKSCELVGGEEEAALPFAAAVEMLHTFTLIHDDIMDSDHLRRGVPTVHVRWGLPIGIAAGDLLFAKVYEALIRSPSPPTTILSCMERLTEAAIAICEGQTLDISFPSASEVSEEDYLRMIGLKTATLFKACAEIGAIIGGGTPEAADLLGGYAYNLGLAFQLVDDCLGLTSREEELGKPVGSDIREGKKTLIVINAYKKASPSEREAIKRVLGNREASVEELEEVKKVLERLGSIEYTLSEARRHAERARGLLEAFQSSDAREALMSLAEYVVERRR